MNFTDIEQEVIFLKASSETIDSIVNHEMLTLSGGEEAGEALFKSATHQRLFNIILVDFLSKSAKEVTGKSNSYLGALALGALAEICEKPNFNQHDSVKSLKRAVIAFKKWLEHEIKVKVWLSSIELKTKLKVLRQEFIKICGNISKHNFSRLSKTVDDLKNILSRSAVELSDEDGLLIIDDFYERFHTDILGYHGSHLVEQLNNIRWGIQEYLEPEFKSSIVYEGGNLPKYRYTYPNGINTEFAKNCYWELMNDVRRRPYVRRFKTYDMLKKAY